MCHDCHDPPERKGNHDMAASLPDAHTRWRCGGCGNLTRFDVTRTRRTTEFWHFDLAGEHRVEESTTDEEDVVHGDLPLVRTLRRRRAGLPCGSGRVHAVTGAEALEPDPAVPGLDRPLPDRVRARVVALTADVAGPAAGRPGAGLAGAGWPSFAPARRARLAATQIASVLAADDDFREHVAADVRAQVPDLAGALDAGTPPSAADPVDLAAVAYLIRPDGWAELVAAAGGRVAGRGHRGRGPPGGPAGRAAPRARSRRSPRASRRPARRHREQVAELKAENADLRHKLGDARARARSAETAADAAAAAAAAVRGRGGRGVGPARGRAAPAAGPGGGARARPGRRSGAPSAPNAGRRRCARGCCSTRCSRPRRGCAGSWRCRRSRARPPTPSRRTSPSTAAARPRGTARWPPTTRRCSSSCSRCRGCTWSWTATTSPRRPGPSCRWSGSATGCWPGLAPLVARSGAEVTVVFDAADSDGPAAGRTGPAGCGCSTARPG